MPAVRERQRRRAPPAAGALRESKRQRLPIATDINQTLPAMMNNANQTRKSRTGIQPTLITDRGHGPNDGVGGAVCIAKRDEACYLRHGDLQQPYNPAIVPPAQLSNLSWLHAPVNITKPSQGGPFAAIAPQGAAGTALLLCQPVTCPQGVQPVVVTRAPFIDVAQPYILGTPQGNRLNIDDPNEFLMAVDKSVMQRNAQENPAMAARAAYAQAQFRSWRQLEKQVNPSSFMLSFPDDCEMEVIRLMAIVGIFEFAVAAKLHINTIHLAVMNVGRLLHHLIENYQKQPLTDDVFTATVMAALRKAVKMEESFIQSDKFRVPHRVWKASSFFESKTGNLSAKYLNMIEGENFKILDHPIHLPCSPEFLERFLTIGSWPEENAQQYRQLALFFVTISLFAHGEDNSLKGCVPSRLAAAALVLAVKVINADAGSLAYEFWPLKLEAYSRYSIHHLRPIIKGISGLLRNKPLQAAILTKLFPKWAGFDWN